MLLTNTMLRGRRLLVVLLVYISSGSSYWYTLNGDTSHDLSLARHLGFYSTVDYYAFLVSVGLASYIEKANGKELQISKNEWDDLLKDPSFHGLDLEMNTKSFDLKDAADHGRFDYHVIRIGKQDEDSQKNILWQVKRGYTSPPPLNKLSSMQRSFLRNIRRMITDTIINNRDVYNDAMEGGRNYESDSDDDSDLDDGEDTSTTASKNVDESMPTPSPKKKMKLSFTSTADSTAPNEISPPILPVKRTKYHLVEKALGASAEDIKTDPSFKDDINRLCTQTTSLVQEMAGDKVGFTFKDMRNGKDLYFVKVPVTESDETFNKYGTWLRKSLERNGGKGGIFKSTKRAAKYLRKHQTEAFEESVKEMGMSAPGKMSAVQIAAMWKAGNVTGREQRRMILRHLRHHFGKGCFEPEYKVQLLCDGHTIQYTYEDGDHEETIDFDYKDVALEVVAQLTRHLQALNISPDMVKSIDVITGADHGIGAFIAGSRIVVTLYEPTSTAEDTAESEEDNDPICFEISVAEIICRKDNAEILSRTIQIPLTEGLRKLSENDIVLTLNEDKQIVCSFDPPSTDDTSAKSIRPEMYIVGDLAFYGMILGKEGMSGNWPVPCRY